LSLRYIPGKLILGEHFIPIETKKLNFQINNNLYSTSNLDFYDKSYDKIDEVNCLLSSLNFVLN